MTTISIQSAASSELGLVVANANVPLLVSSTSGVVSWANVTGMAAYDLGTLLAAMIAHTNVRTFTFADALAVSLLSELATKDEQSLTFTLVAELQQDGAKVTKLRLTGIAAIKHQVFEHYANVNSIMLTITPKG